MIQFTPNPNGFWLQWIDGQLWLMFKQYKISRQATTAEELDAFLKERKL